MHLTTRDQEAPLLLEALIVVVAVLLDPQHGVDHPCRPAVGPHTAVIAVAVALQLEVLAVDLQAVGGVEADLGVVQGVDPLVANVVEVDHLRGATGVVLQQEVTGVAHLLVVTGVAPLLEVTGVAPLLEVTGVAPLLEVTGVAPLLEVTGVAPLLEVTEVDLQQEVTGVAPLLVVAGVGLQLVVTGVGLQLVVTGVAPLLVVI